MFLKKKSKEKILYYALVFLAISLSSILLCSIAIYNHYPLFFNHDSGVYIENAFRINVAIDRPLLYSLFILGLSFTGSLWGVVITQAVILSTVLFFYFTRLSNRPKHKLAFYLIFISVISFTMSASFEVSWIMADVFTPITILSLGALLFSHDISRRWSILLSVILLFGVGVHNSHFIICLCLWGCSFILTLIAKPKLTKEPATFKLKKWLTILGVCIAGQCISASVHFVYGDDFKALRGGSVFLFSNLIEMGIVDNFLSEKCSEKKYTICLYKDSLPNNFLWAENGPISKTGGWKANEAEYGKINKEILTTPKYLLQFLWKSFIYTGKQLSNFDFSDVKKPSSRVSDAVEDNYYWDFPNFLKSRQYTETLNLAPLSFIQNFTLGIILVFSVIMATSDFPPRYKLLLFYFLAAIFINAMVCSMFSGVYPRYQTRVTFLVAIPVFLTIQDCPGKIYNIIKLIRRPNC